MERLNKILSAVDSIIRGVFALLVMVPSALFLVIAFGCRAICSKTQDRFLSFIGLFFAFWGILLMTFALWLVGEENDFFHRPDVCKK